MSTIRRAAAVTPVAATVLAVALASGTAGCSLLRPRSRGHQAVVIRLGRCMPSALAAVLDRGPATLVWPEFRTMVAGTVRCGEHLFVIDAGSGRQLGSFTAPPNPAMRVAAPPPPPPPGSTSFLTAKYHQAVGGYRDLIRTALARLRARERRQQAAWAASVVARVAQGNGVGLDPAGHSLIPALDSGLADFASLRQSGVALGSRKVLAVLGLTGLRDSVPAVPASLAGATVVATGFPPRPGLRRAWRSGLRWEGAAGVVLLTRAAIGELTHVCAAGLAGR